MRTALVLIAVLLSVTLFGCKGNCRQLSERLCECEPNTPLREQCIQRVATEEGRIGSKLDSAAENRCEALLKTCDCKNLDTDEGKRACGLAWYPNGTHLPDAGQ